MTDLAARAAAIAEMLLLEQPASIRNEIAEAVTTCCGDLVNAGEPNLALELLDRVGSSLSAGSDWLIRIAVLRVQALRASGEYGLGLDLARRALESSADLRESHAAEFALLRIGEAACLWQLNRVDEAVDLLMRLRAELISRPDSTSTARCMLELSSAEVFRGRLERGRAHTLEAIVSSRRCRDRYIESVALANLGRIEKFLCRWPAAAEAFEGALSINDSDGHRLQGLITRRMLGVVAWKRGDLRDAITHSDRCLVDARALGNHVQEWYATQALGLVRLHMGDFDEARRLFGEGTSKDVLSVESRRALLTSEYIGDTYLEQGDAQTALDRYNAVWPLAIALIPRGDIVAELRRRRAEAYYLLGRHEEALLEAKGALEHCRELGDRYEEAATYRTLAQSAAALGRPVEAKQWFDQGFAYYDDVETPYEWGKLWLAYGEWLAGPQSADYASREGVVDAFLAARDHFERMGALGMIKRVQARLAEVQPKPSMTPPPEGSPQAVDLRRPPRRPRGAAELDRRSAWVRETYGIVTRNKILLDLLDDVGKLAQSDSPILLLGESGTGKELVAGGIHRLSGRPGSYMPINCGALPRDVIESELFGHVAGAFTGASRDKMGLFESCHLGTVFLDEIGEMSLDLQSRLLRFLETGEFRRVGSNKNVSVDTLVVAATNRDRATLESQGDFRADLYYRLAHAVIQLPPLRRRGEDLDLLIDHFLAAACARHKKQIVLSPGARNRLIAYSWPGNVRQLRSVLQRLVILSPDNHEIPTEAVDLDRAQAPANLSEELEQAERRKIVEALAAANGVRTEAAKVLGMSRTTLLGKMQRYGIR